MYVESPIVSEAAPIPSSLLRFFVDEADHPGYKNNWPCHSYTFAQKNCDTN